MKKYGFIKTLIDGDNEIKLKANTNTIVLYKGYFKDPDDNRKSADLLKDLMNYTKKAANYSQDANLGKLTEMEITEENALELLNSVSDSFEFDTTFINQFIASLIANAMPEPPSAREAMEYVPPHWATDPDIITELFEFFPIFMKPKNN